MILEARFRASRGPLSLDVTLTIPVGIHVLFGPSGAGKSTTLACLAGLLAPTSGRIALGARVLFDGDAKVSVPPHERRVGFVFQSLALFPHLTALENAAYGVPKDRSKRQREELAHAALSSMHAAHLASRYPATFSGGEAQRVAIARALASSPLVLLLDEPFSALDPALRRELGAELTSLVDARKLPTLLVTHDVEDARSFGQRAMRMEAGTITREGSIDELLGVR